MALVKHDGMILEVTANDDGTVDVKDSGLKFLPWEKGSPDRMPPTVARNARKYNQQALAPIERLANMKTSGSSDIDIKRQREAQQMGFFDKAGHVAIDESRNLVEGAKNIGDFAEHTISNLVGADESADAALKRTYDRGIESYKQDIIMKPVMEEAGISNIARIVPYIVTGSILEKPVQMGIEGMVKGATSLVAGAGQGIRNMRAKSGKNWMNRGKAIGGNARSGTANPLGPLLREYGLSLRKSANKGNLKAAAKSKTPIMVDPFREGIKDKVLTQSAVSGIEGGLHSDSDALLSAGAAVPASLLGSKINSMLYKSPIVHGASDLKVVDWAKRQGYPLTPGEKTGIGSMQKFESKLRGSHDLSDLMDIHDNGYQIVDNRKAAEVMGMKPNSPMTPTSLREHRQNLKNEYNLLQKDSDALVKPDDIKAMIDDIKVRTSAGTESNVKAKNIAMAHLREIAKASNARRVDDEIVFDQFSGKSYQDLSRGIKQEIDSNIDNPTVMGLLKDIQKTLDSGMEKGIAEKSGTATAAQWRDLKERDAISRLVQKYGSNSDGSVNSNKLNNYFMNSEPERYLSESGGRRITTLHKMAKLGDIKSNVKKFGLGGGGSDVVDKSIPSLIQRAIASPLLSKTPLLPSMYVNRYLSGYPSVEGLLNTKLGGANDVSKILRANESANRPKEKTLGLLQSAYDYMDQMFTGE